MSAMVWIGGYALKPCCRGTGADGLGLGLGKRLAFGFGLFGWGWLAGWVAVGWLGKITVES